MLDTSNSLLEGNSIGTALNKGIFGAATGGTVGSIAGGLTGGVHALRQGKDFLEWKGYKQI